MLKTPSRIALAFAAFAAILLAATLGTAQTAPASPAAQSGFRAEFLRQLDDVENKIKRLADAVPGEKYSWRPGPGVRSVGEVYMHIAGANFSLPNRLWGAAKADEPGLDLRNLEKLGGDKAKVTEVLGRSFAYLRRAVGATPDADLDRATQIFGHPGTVREGMFLVANHLHEHLGQSIAYARSNGVVPPWSAAQGAGR
jgi:uncharacterized damage-inducible protein DinB